MNKLSKLSFLMITFCMALFLGISVTHAQGTTVYGYNVNGGGGIPAGPFYFNLNNPGVVTSIQDQSALVDPFAGAWANGVWYAGVGTDLITFNTTTGARTIIGSMGRTMNGMAYDITTNTMFGVANEGGVGNLYSINLTNGVTSLVGSNGAGIVFINLACDNNGQLYSIDIATDAFYRINKTTAAVTLIGPLGYDFNYIQDMEFDLINNVCYAAAVFNENGWKCDLLTIDIETGVASLYANFPNRNLEVSAFAIPFTPECLAFPHLFEPLNKSVQVVTSPTFLWLDVANAITYSIQIATDANFTNIAFEEDGITGTSFNLPIGSELEYVTQYWWRIKAHGEGNCNSYWSNKWTFTTEGNVVPPVLISPADNATGVFSYPTLTWVPSPGAVYYHIQIATDEYFNDLVYDTENIPTSQFFARALELENTYYWRVMGYNSAVYSDWSEEWTFTTTAINPVFGYNANGAGGIYEGPVVFELTNPSNMYSLQNQADLNFVRAGTWANDVWYGSVYDGTNGNLISINKATGARTNIGALNLNVSGMSYDVTTETLYAVVLTDIGTSLYSINLTNGAATLVGACGERTFINLSCDINGDLYAIDLGDDIFYFIDKYTAIPTAIGPTGFDANYAQDMEFDKENNICYWAGYTTQGRLFTIDITTGAATLVSNFPGGMELTGFAIPFDNPCLAFPQLNEPANNSYCQGITPNFDWDDVAGANTYALQISTDKNFTNIVYESNGLSSSSYSLPAANALENLSQYYWRIMAFGPNDCNSMWSGRFAFITEGDLPNPLLVNPLNNADGINPTTTFNWIGNIAATSYHLQVSSTPDFIGIIIDEGTLTETTYTYSSLAAFTQYYWRVSMANPCDESDWSDVWTFTTGYSFVIGTGTTINDDVTYPAPYGNFFFGAKHQMLVLADELTAAGATPGFLTSLAFNVGAIYSLDPLFDFTIKMKQTTANQLITGWDEVDLQQVYYSPAYFNTLGWNSHQFDVPFIWDGVSNILIDVCFNNTFWSSNQGTYYTPTTFNSVLYNAADLTTVCSVSGTATSSLNRPNMMFVGMEGEPLPPAPVLSSPANGATGQDINPYLVWTGVAEAANYRVQISNDVNFNNLIVNAVTPEIEYLVPANLNYSTQYWWRVRSITQLGTLGPWTDAWSFTTMLESMNINLASGWNMISGYLNPVNIDIVQIYAPIVSDVKLVKNGVGQMYDPAFNINTIGNWYYADAYLVNMLNDNTLTITGQKITPELTPLFLNNGWNLTAYLRDNPMSPVTALSNISSTLVLAKNNAGGLYVPAYGINTIGNMQPGEGYYMYLSGNNILTYPANGALKTVSVEGITPNAKLLVPAYKNTGNNATLILSIDNYDGNEIGVFNANNVLIGSAIVNNGVAAVTIWGDDELSPIIDGATNNEILFVKLYVSKTNSYIDINLSDISDLTNNTEINNQLSYSTNSIYFAKASLQNGMNFDLSIATVPNPVSNSTSFEFTLPFEANAEIQIYNVTGELVAKIARKSYSAGFNKVHFDASNLANGVYNVVLSSTEGRCSTTMIVNE